MQQLYGPSTSTHSRSPYLSSSLTSSQPSVQPKRWATMSYYDNHRGIGPMGEIQPTSTRPTNSSQRPNPEGTIYVETAMPPPLTTSNSNGSNPSNSAPSQSQSQSQGQTQSHPDLAGVLRRNQACLNCRRRKLASPLYPSRVDVTDDLEMRCDETTLRDMYPKLQTRAQDFT